jgi:hypothetical protein
MKHNSTVPTPQTTLLPLGSTVNSVRGAHLLIVIYNKHTRSVVKL